MASKCSPIAGLNVIVIHGNRRVGDIYLTEFNRLWNHYYFRSVHESLAQDGHDDHQESHFLAEDSSWIKKYEPGTLRSKRLALYSDMEVPRAPRN